MAEGGTRENETDVYIPHGNYQEQSDELVALQSIYESGVKRIQVLNSPTGDKDGGLFAALITIQVQPFNEGVTVRVEDFQDDVIAEQEEATLPSNESQNGAKLEEFRVKYLPPLNLQVVLPPTYPTEDGPEFTISCPWLTANQLSALADQLDKLWNEAQNLPVIFTWTEWLGDNIVSFLDIKDTIEISVGGQIDDARVACVQDITEAVAIIREYNSEEEAVEFKRSSHECPVCCEEFMGSKLHRLSSCGHFLCPDCMSEFCLHHVTAGTVESIRCPDTECESIIPPHIVQSVLPGHEFDRWERLMLQKTLENMTDICWCPRCNNPVIQEAEEDLNLAHCISCFFSFCTQCREPWHQGSRCITIEDKLAAVTNNVDVSFDWEEFNEERRKLEEEFHTQLSLQKNMKRCPRCKVKIEKISGCNRMTCKCGTKFCWLCGLVVTDYRHFIIGNSSCRLNDLSDLTSVVENITPQNIDYIGRLVRPRPDDGADRGQGHRFISQASCPTCRYRNIKVKRNNHIKCRCCRTNFCFVCREKIQGIVTSHFVPGGCPQHS